MLNRLTGISMKGHELLGAILFVFYLYGLSVFTYQIISWLGGLFDKKIKRNLLAKRLYKATFADKANVPETVTLCNDDFTIVILRKENEKHIKKVK